MTEVTKQQQQHLDRFVAICYTNQIQTQNIILNKIKYGTYICYLILKILEIQRGNESEYIGQNFQKES